jgi:lambda family phage portal protein
MARGLREIQSERVKGNYKRRSPRYRQRQYDGAKTSELLADWNISQTSADAEIKSALRQARSRSRDLERNNDYVNRFLHMNESNVIGPRGIELIPNVKNSSGKPDIRVNELLEDSFRRWGKYGICTADGQYSWQGAQRQVSRGTPRDGEMLVRLLRGVDNPWRFAIQLLEPDHIDTDLDNVRLGNGNIIKMGVELDSFRRQVAYHIKAEHPGDYAFYNGGRQTARIPASEMRLIFLPLRAESTRGFPWINTSMVRLKMIGAYDEAEVVAARYGASKMGVIKTIDKAANPEYNGDDTDDIGNPIQDIAPGIIEKLPYGFDFDFIDPTHPSKNYGEFNKAALRGVASGLNVSYVSLANNLEGVNFSSIRQGVIDERDMWRLIQGFYVERFHDWVYQEWLKMAMLTDLAGSLTPSRLPQYLNQQWQARGWEWVDPKKDAEGKVIEIDNKITSRTRVCRQKGYEFKDIVAEQAAEEALVEGAGLEMSKVTQAVATAPVKEDEEEMEDRILERVLATLKGGQK